MNLLTLATLVMLAAIPVSAESVQFTRIGGGAGLLGLSDAKTDMGTVQGEKFKELKGEIQKVVNALVKHERWMSKEAAWWDVGPDAGYLSAVVKMEGKTYTIHSWYPLLWQSPTIAVSETQGLVSVKSKKEKQDVESRNSAGYRQIVAIFNLIPPR
jgi:hypothetical protein